jgi:radical SAM protein (TIGR01212 family)
MFKYSLDNKRYHTLNYYYKNKYGKKVFKVSLNGGFSCPNKVNGHGCIFCSRLGSGDFAGNVNEPLNVQFNNIKNMMLKKWPDAYYIAYFQANTNTYAPTSILKEKYESVLKYPGVIGISIATRPDAITEDCLKYLSELNKRTNLTIELGLQSIHEKTLKLINRGHDLKCFEDTYKKLKDQNIKVVVHIIDGLPYETKDMMLETVKYLNKLQIDGIKIHMLHIIKDTDLSDLYAVQKFHVLTEAEFVDIVVSQLELLNPEVVIHRLTGDPKKEDLIEPVWLLKKFQVLDDIDKEMVKRNTWQGKRSH